MNFKPLFQIKSMILLKIETALKEMDCTDIPKVKLIELAIKLVDKLGEKPIFKTTDFLSGFDQLTDFEV